MIDPKLCFSAKNEIVKISASIVANFDVKEDYAPERDVYRFISDAMCEIESTCSSDVRERYRKYILSKYPLWVSDEAFKRIRLEEIQSSLSKMRDTAKSHMQNIS
jgi:hypothetical protein